MKNKQKLSHYGCFQCGLTWPEKFVMKRKFAEVFKCLWCKVIITWTFPYTVINHA